MPLDDLSSVLDEPTLALPVHGKEIIVRPCRADVWLRLQRVSASEVDPNIPGAERIRDHELFRLSLGDDLFERLLGELSGPELSHVGTTAYLWQLGRDDLAVAYWASGGKASAAPETPTPTPRTTHTGAATTTRRRASGTGTSTRRKNSASGKG